MAITKDDAYWKFITDEAERRGSDGCTLVSEWNQRCCYEHDLGCSGKDPEDAFRLHMEGGENVWEYAAPLSRRQADLRFYSCNRAAGSGFKDRLRSCLRFLGVRIGAWLPN